MGNGESTRIKDLMDELKRAAEEEGCELFIFSSKDNKYRVVIDMELRTADTVQELLRRYFDRAKMLDLLKN